MIAIDYISILENYVYFLGKFLTVIIPLSFTVFIFAYREQKELAYSQLKKSKRFPFWGFTIFLVILVLFIIIFVPQTSDVHEELPKWVVFLISGVSLFWLFFTVLSYRLLIINVNALKAFDKNISYIKRNISIIDRKIKDKHRNSRNEYKPSRDIEKRIKSIIISSEICFQILMSKQKFKLNKDFTDSLEKLENALIEPIEQINKDEELFSDVAPYFGSQYYELYEIVLNNLNLLLETSSNNFRDSEINSLLESITKIRPFGFHVKDDLKRGWFIYQDVNSKNNSKGLEVYFKSFFDQYFISIYQTIMILSTNKDNRIVKLLENIIIQEFDNSKYVRENDFLTLNTALFVKNIEQNNLKILTDVTNTYLKYLQRSYDSHELPRMNKLKVKSNIQNIINQKAKVPEIENKMVKVIFLGIVKAIELGHYNCAGFLIKILIKNFDSRKLSAVAKKVYDNINNTRPYLNLSAKLTSKLHINLTFSPASYEYCFLKTILLLRVQQEYTYKNKIVSFNNFQSLNLELFFDIENKGLLKYLFEKIEGLNTTYGLVSLKACNLEELRNEF